ncbi:hypothetical protein DB32_008044 [Sandaracinus amylolyticus]|uniref:Uncharacterized protein n=1 Tax=Sandaracinus amylolyticus TaxID=927083 RepID=A0A0F6YNY7_9BACT|nr:hypothetical protein DB32_008044 [Sandaracinus amylolyticus]
MPRCERARSHEVTCAPEPHVDGDRGRADIADENPLNGEDACEDEHCSSRSRAR